MTSQLFTASAVMLLLTGPVFADCRQELQRLSAAVTAAETGAATDSTGMPATKHQQETLRGKQAGGEEITGSVGGTTGQAEMPATKHQEQVLRGAQGTETAPSTGSTGSASEQSGLPATKHQEQVLAGEEKAAGQMATGSTGPTEPASPHQEQAVGTQAGEPDVGELMSEARRMAAAGDEQGCMAKLAEAKGLLGTE